MASVKGWPDEWASGIQTIPIVRSATLPRDYVANEARAPSTHPPEIEAAMAKACEPSDDWDTEELPR